MTNRLLVKVLTLTAFMIIVFAGGAVAGAFYTDVTAADPHAQAIEWAAGNSLIEGYPDGTFKPNSPVTRGQIVSMLYRYDRYQQSQPAPAPLPAPELAREPEPEGDTHVSNWRSSLINHSRNPEGTEEWLASIFDPVDFDFTRLPKIAVVIGDGSHFDYTVATIEEPLVGMEEGARVLFHEVGHAVDKWVLTDDDRDFLLDQWGADVVWDADVPHHERPLEAFASYFQLAVSEGHLAYPFHETNHYFTADGVAAVLAVLK